MIPTLLNRTISNQDRRILELPVRLRGRGIVNPSTEAKSNYQYSKRVTRPLTEHIIEQKHELPDEAETLKIKKEVEKDKLQRVEQRTKDVLQEASEEMQRAVKLSQKKGSSSWLSIIPLKEMEFTLNKKKIHDAVSLRYDWEINDIPSKRVCGERFDVNHAMICMNGESVVQRHNELRDLEDELLNLLCKDVGTEPVLQDITGGVLGKGANTSQEARVDIHARGFWERKRSAFFDVRVCHPNAESYADLTPQQIYSTHENEKKRKYAELILQIDQGTFTPLIFTTTEGMIAECQMFHSRLAELTTTKKAEK